MQKWIEEARKYLGLNEIPGPKHNATILSWLSQLKAWWKEDETPWCGTFVAHCIRESDLAIPQYWMRAKAWADWGMKLKAAIPGCIVVFEREGGGHVGFVVGRDQKGNIMVLGGNQGNRVSIAPFSTARVIAYVWPTAVPVPQEPLPLLASNGQLSTNEA